MSEENNNEFEFEFDDGFNDEDFELNIPVEVWNEFFEEHGYPDENDESELNEEDDFLSEIFKRVLSDIDMF